MSNCDFYATIEDHELILNQLFEENNCEIYELSSDFEKPLKQFSNTEEVLAEFSRSYPNGKKWPSVYLQIYVVDCGFKFTPNKVALSPEKCEGFKYRYNADNFGLIQLYLEAPTKKGLSNSHTNHNTRKRAERWARTPEEIIEIESCDFSKISQFSSKLNRFIIKNSVAKVSSRPVLSGALGLWNEGINLNPYLPSETKIELK